MQNIKKNGFFSIYILTFCLLFGMNLNLKSQVTLPPSITKLIPQTNPDKKDNPASTVKMKRDLLDISILILKSPTYREAIFTNEPKLKSILDAQRKTTFAILLPAINTFITEYYTLFVSYCVEQKFEKGTNDLKAFFSKFIALKETKDFLTEKMNILSKNIKEKFEPAVDLTTFNNSFNEVITPLLSNATFLNSLNLILFKPEVEPAQIEKVKATVIKEQREKAKKAAEEEATRIKGEIEKINAETNKTTDKAIETANNILLLKGISTETKTQAEKAKTDAETAKANAAKAKTIEDANKEKENAGKALTTANSTKITADKEVTAAKKAAQELKAKKEEETTKIEKIIKKINGIIAGIGTREDITPKSSEDAKAALTKAEQAKTDVGKAETLEAIATATTEAQNAEKDAIAALDVARKEEIEIEKTQAAQVIDKTINLIEEIKDALKAGA